jgi:ABC-type transport system involved in multi-copper enzyme maturation permease subunit
MPSPGVLFAGLIFGLIGIAAFTYGRKSAQFRPMLIGVALMAFPYFVSGLWLLYAIGIGLCIVLYFWTE